MAPRNFASHSSKRGEYYTGRNGIAPKQPERMIVPYRLPLPERWRTIVTEQELDPEEPAGKLVLPGLAFYESMQLAARRYLEELLATSPTAAAAATTAGLNRTHFYRVCHRYGVRGGPRRRPRQSPAAASIADGRCDLIRREDCEPARPDQDYAEF